MKGKLIVIEGLEYAGKTGIAGRLARRLGAVCGGDPGKFKGDAYLATIRRELTHNASVTCPTERLLAYAIARARLCKLLRESLDSGETVVMDRFYFSSVAYNFFGDEVHPDYLRAALRPAFEIDLVPDLVLYAVSSVDWVFKQRDQAGVQVPMMETAEGGWGERDKSEQDAAETAGRRWFLSVASGYYRMFCGDLFYPSGTNLYEVPHPHHRYFRTNRQAVFVTSSDTGEEAWRSVEDIDRDVDSWVNLVLAGEKIAPTSNQKMEVMHQWYYPGESVWER